MPFDGSENSSAVNRRVLIEALRGTLPEGFTWGYNTTMCYKNHCGTVGCAMGLAQKIGLIDDAYNDHEIMERFGITHKQLNEVFMGEHSRYDGLDMREITPQMVADVLEAIGP